jgi:hypothetical protein
MSIFLRFLQSPANWLGLGLAMIILILKSLGFLGFSGLALAALAYTAGFIIGSLWWGFPKLRGSAWDALEFSDEGDTREVMARALSGLRDVVKNNPENRLPTLLQTKVLQLCDALDQLLAQWEHSKGALSLQESFHARHIAISYLPEALKTYLSIPSSYAASHVMDNGKTAQDTFDSTLAELQGKVLELGNDLAEQDSQAFLSHSRFLKDKFGNVNPLNMLSAPSIQLAKNSRPSTVSTPISSKEPNDGKS